MRAFAALAAGAAVLALGACDPAAEPTAVQRSRGAGSPAGNAAVKTPPVKLVAKRATATKSMLSDGGPLSCARVTVTNQTKKKLEVNPLYFSLTDDERVKHDAAQVLGAYEDEISTTTLAPQEKATGFVCGKGTFTPKVIAMTNPLFSEAARAEVA